MRVQKCVVLAVLLLLLGACDDLPETSPPASAPANSSTPAVLPSDPGFQNTDTPAPPSPTPSVTVTEDWEYIFRNFVTENYAELQGDIAGSLVGVGFIDLDVDGTPELLLFDSGASASMGVNFFDIIGGEVECVSSNLSFLGELFGGKHLCSEYVNANYFDEFGLIQNSSGQKLFYVYSRNGNEESGFSELIVFDRHNGALRLTSLVKKIEERNLESGDIEKTTYEKNGEEISSEEYDRITSEFFADCIELEYEATGTFIWEKSEYDSTLDSFLMMFQHSLEIYAPLTV